MTSDRTLLLGVERSVTGRRWERRAGDERTALALAQRHGLLDAVAAAMAARGIDLDSAELFLNPSLREQLPDPLHLRDMDRAVARLVRAVEGGETIAVFGDYDVDGATSAALLRRFFEAVGARIRVYVPDRMTEGYGPNLPALLRLQGEGAGVVVTVDCGITAFDALDGAAAAGLDVVVVDHHVAEPRLPRAVAVVNPNRLDDPSPLGHVAAVGVAFLLVVALNRALREAGWYRVSGRREPDLLQWLDLVALGTVCDVVPLTGLNRAFVTQGLRIMARRGNIGLCALGDVARLDRPPEAYHAGFLLGPRVNAGGRVGEAALGAELLAIADTARAREIAERLDAYNAERRAIEAACLEQAMEQVEGAGGDGLVFVAADGWHPGVIGIVAGRLKDRYNRPACVVARSEGIGKGSGRSVPGIDLGAAVVAARQAGLLVNGGGHPMAAGFTLDCGREAALRDFLADRIAGQIGPGGIVPRLGIDAAVQPAGATPELTQMLARLGPFGAGNPEPRFALPATRIVRADIVGGAHVRCILAGEGGGRLKGIAFRAVDTPLGDTLLGAHGMPLHLAGHLRLDSWQGRDEVQLTIEDAARV
ncbi:MAG: single-stranded-DNA-specific exonuclease RecJ [Alphaproteobacteria bacterium]